MPQKSPPADFSALREAFGLLSDIIRMNGKIAVTRTRLSLSGIPRVHWNRLSRGVREHDETIRTLLQGPGPRSSLQGRVEVVLSVIAIAGDVPGFEIAALKVVGRSAVESTITIAGADALWKEKLSSFVDWSSVQAVIAAAEGNNQRAMIGMVLQLAGIGQGKLPIIEAEIPEEIDEAAQSIRGADWLKAGLPRFESAAGEALWYLMRIRSVHSRMIRQVKQGYYTSMALAAMYASGLSIDDICKATALPFGLVEKLVPHPDTVPVDPAQFKVIGTSFMRLADSEDRRRAYCAARVWKGAAIYARVLDRRIRLGEAARRRLAEGDDIVSISRDLRISRRDLVRVLSVRQSDAIMERERFVGAIIDPDLVRKASCA